MMRTRQTTPLALATVAAALAATGCGAARETTSSTTAATAAPTIAAETATPTPTPTPTASPTATPTSATSAAPGGTELAVTADPTGQLKYTESTLTAKAGNTTIDFTNQAPIPHNVAIRQDGGKPIVETPTVTGKSTKVDVKLKPGTYEYYCTVPGHEEAGMKGTLTVK